MSLLRNLLAAVPAFVLYIGALVSPVLRFQHSSSTPEPGGFTEYPGWQALLPGILTVFAGQFGWLGNPLGLVAVISLILGKPRLSIVFAGLAILISLDTLRLFSVSIPADEGGSNQLYLRQLLLGYYLWVASFAAILVAAAVMSFTTRKP